MELVKITRNRQVTIPKKLFDQLELDEGDYLEVTRDGNEIVFQPQNISPREREQAEEELFDLVDRIRERNEDVDPELVEEEVQKAIQNLRDEQSSYGDDEE
jgi:AbrB family looped-hinge helix DNA binding protein